VTKSLFVLRKIHRLKSKNCEMILGGVLRAGVWRMKEGFQSRSVIYFGVCFVQYKDSARALVHAFFCLLFFFFFSPVVFLLFVCSSVNLRGAK
jgi:hypothetical protein